MITLYGIPNCDTVKKARTWLAAQGIDCVFHDFKKQGVPPEQLDIWLNALDWQTLVNRKGTTWRKLDTALQTAVCDAASAKAVMLLHASVIKRPVVNWGERITVGFDSKVWAELYLAMPPQ